MCVLLSVANAHAHSSVTDRAGLRSLAFARIGGIGTLAHALAHTLSTRRHRVGVTARLSFAVHRLGV